MRIKMKMIKARIESLMDRINKESFCFNCKEYKKYIVRKEYEYFNLNNLRYIPYKTTRVVCSKCGRNMNPNWLITKNIKEFEKAYDKAKKSSEKCV